VNNCHTLPALVLSTAAYGRTGNIMITFTHALWVAKRLLKPLLCVDCKKLPSYDLANISQNYSRDLSDWEWLCRKCHMTKDGRLENFKNSRNISEKNCAKISYSNPVLENLLLFQDITFAKNEYQFLINYSNLQEKKTSENKIFIEIIENYLLHHLIYKNNEKLIVDISKNLLFSKDFSTNISWSSKRDLLFMIYMTILKDVSVKYYIFENKNEIFKKIGLYLNFNILKK
jgi:hypothetical protein